MAMGEEAKKEEAKTQQEAGTMTVARQGRLVVPLLGVVAGVAIVGAGIAATLLVQEREARKIKERQLAVVQAENQDLQLQVDEIQTAKQHVEMELSRAKAQLSEATQQLADAQEAKDALAQTVQERQLEVDRLSKDLEQIRTERGALVKELAELKTQQEAMRTQLSALKQTKADRDTRGGEASGRASVELEKVVVAHPEDLIGAPMPASATQGQVVVVNREYDFIVINLGKRQGLALGQEFQVVRDQQVLGRVKVEKIYDELSAAAILPNSNKDAIREGDDVKAL
jgi:DNA repair exonuclease SbcCD ATPase subunit